MRESFAEILAVGGKSNSLGRSNEVVEAVLGDESLIEELYRCMFHDDAWVRMRAADSLEKVCRVHPEWLESYIDRFIADLSSSDQPSIQWHLAQMYQQVPLNQAQRESVVGWLKDLLQSAQLDWIVSANAMDTLAQFVRNGFVPAADAQALFTVQTTHKSKAVVKRAHKLLDEIAR